MNRSNYLAMGNFVEYRNRVSNNIKIQYVSVVHVMWCMYNMHGVVKLEQAGEGNVMTSSHMLLCDF